MLFFILSRPIFLTTGYDTTGWQKPTRYFPSTQRYSQLVGPQQLVPSTAWWIWTQNRNAEIVCCRMKGIIVLRVKLIGFIWVSHCVAKVI